MTRFLLLLSVVLGTLLSARPAKAFTLLGELPTWFTDNAGQWVGVDIYGPMNLGEEYRWVTPQIVYGFDESFLNYFGERGVQEVEKAIAILNDLPTMSTVRFEDYPTMSTRVNYRARDLQLWDLKSATLNLLLEELGVGRSPRYTYTLRLRDTPPNATNYLVIMRNFDPVTWEPTAYVNGQLWTYLSIYDNQSDPINKASTIPEPVDPLLLAEPVAGGFSGYQPSLFGLGSFYTGLTRDDVGGLYYIYRKENRNVETLPADAFGTAGLISSGSGGGGEWTPIPVVIATNTAAGGGGAVTTNGVVFYPQALRPGKDRIQFVRSGSGIVYQPNAYQVTNRFEDTALVVITNGVERTVTQRVSRFITTPDILFTAADLAGPTSPGFMRRTELATSNDAINGLEGLDGPGQFAGPGRITYSKVGPAFFNSQPSFLAQPETSIYYIWGSFDGSTNEPAVYPTGTNIRAIEQRIFGGR